MKYLTDDERPYYGKLPDINQRITKRIYLADKNSVDGEDATQMIPTNDTMDVKEAFIDSLPQRICFEGEKGLLDAFIEWKNERKPAKK